MVEPNPPRVAVPPLYQAPAILWETEMIALATCSPPCQGNEVCVVDTCIPKGG